MIKVIRENEGIITVAETTYRKYYIDFDLGTLTPLRNEDGDYIWLEDPDED